MKGLYVHIPFCKTICTYCDFPKLIAKKEEHEKYIARLIDEIDSYHKYIQNLSSIYIGGGTPNSIELSLLEKLLKKLACYSEGVYEYSIELNPELVTFKLASMLSQYGINRVSLGVQTINQNSIKLLNRHHNKDIVINAIDILKSVGINNVNVDMIFGIPYTTVDDVISDLDFILGLPVTHISYYSLIVEERTVLKHRIDKNEISELDDDLIADMYEYVSDKLKANGYVHYEISNYAKPGFESKHNLLYWIQEDYIGVGASAVGFINNRRYTNNFILSKYYNEYVNEFEELTERELKQEYMMLGLRKTKGVSISKYKEKFGTDILDDFNLNKHIENKLLIIDDDQIYINNEKLFIANVVFEEFVEV